MARPGTDETGRHPLQGRIVLGVVTRGAWLAGAGQEAAAEAVRDMCGVISRAELGEPGCHGNVCSGTSSTTPIRHGG